MEVFVGVAAMARKATLSRYFGMRFLLAVFAALAAHLVAPAVHAQQSVVELDAAQTEIDFTLGDVLHTVHGAFKLKSGKIRFDPSTGEASGAIVVDAASGDSGNAGRDRKMHREILESVKFTEITFTPSQVKGTLSPRGGSQMEVSGQFHLHGQDHQLTLPIDIQADGQQLQFTTHFIVPYVEWGLKNPSTFILRVSDKVSIDIHGVAHSASPRSPQDLESRGPSLNLRK
jgi:polyisoprenoid-binding protein YceI